MNFRSLGMLFPAALLLVSNTSALGAPSFDQNKKLQNLAAAPVAKAALPYDLQFIDELTAHHNDGIETATLAVKRSQNQELKSMAQKMIDDQQKDNATMAEWRAERFGNEAPHVDPTGSMDSQELMNATAEEFDRKFLDVMIGHHPAAIFLGIEASRKGHHEEIKNLGKKVAGKQMEELAKMRVMRDSMR